jgi:hypothetical protein
LILNKCYNIENKSEGLCIMYMVFKWMIYIIYVSCLKVNTTLKLKPGSWILLLLLLLLFFNICAQRCDSLFFYFYFQYYNIYLISILNTLYFRIGISLSFKVPLVTFFGCLRYIINIYWKFPGIKMCFDFVCGLRK